MCMYVTDIRRDSNHVYVSYGYQEGELSCVCMLRISGGRGIMCLYATDIKGRAIMCMHVADIRRESYHVYVCYGY